MKEYSMQSTSRWVAAAVAISMGWIGVPASAAAQTSVAASLQTPSAFFKKKKKKKKGKKKKKKSAKGEKQPSLTPEDAEPKRQAIRDSVAEQRETDKVAAAEGLEEGATQLGDPVTMMEAGEVRLEAAKDEHTAEQAEASIVTTTLALDILHYYDSVASGEAESEWLPIDPSSASGMIGDAEQQIADAEAFIAELEDEAEAEDEVVADAGEKKKKKKKRGKPKPGTGLIIGGSIATAVGVAGAGLAIVGMTSSRRAQSDVEELDGDPANQPMIDDLDEEGGRANRMAYIGLGLGVAGLAVGIPLLIVGAKKRKEAGGGKNASVQVSPMVAGATRGFALSGRF